MSPFIKVVLVLLQLSWAHEPLKGLKFHKVVEDLRSTDTREQFTRRLKGWLFDCQLSLIHI